MLKQVLPFLKKSLPIGLAVKGLSSVDPKIAEFLSLATGSGYAIDSALDELRSIYNGPGNEKEKQRLSSRVASGSARPDEMAIQSTKSRVPDIAQKAAASLGGAAVAKSLLGESEPEQQPEVEQKKWEYPEHPRENPSVLPKPFTKSHKKDQSEAKQNASRAGLATTPADMGPKSKEISTTPQEIEIPEHIDKEIRKHMSQSKLSPRDAAHVVYALAQDKVKKDIMSLEKKHKKKFPDIADLVYAAEQAAPEMVKEESVQPQTQQDTVVQGPGHQALMGILQKIHQIRGQR